MTDPASTFAETAPIFTLLGSLAELLGIAGIDELWLFPPRRSSDLETAVVVAAAFLQHDDEDDDRRRVFTAHYTAVTDRKGRVDVQQNIEERAIAPTHRIPRIVEGVMQRLDDELAAAVPRVAHIHGHVDRWASLLDSLVLDHKWGGAARKFVNTDRTPATDGGTEPVTPDSASG